jgi:hypothetical protein
MTRITIDAELEHKLLGFSQEIELCDQHGHIVAWVKPALAVSDFDPLSPPASREELDRRSKSSEKRYSTQEMLDYLGTL